MEKDQDIEKLLLAGVSWGLDSTGLLCHLCQQTLLKRATESEIKDPVVEGVESCNDLTRRTLCSLVDAKLLDRKQRGLYDITADGKKYLYETPMNDCYIPAIAACVAKAEEAFIQCSKLKKSLDAIALKRAFQGPPEDEKLKEIREILNEAGVAYFIAPNLDIDTRGISVETKKQAKWHIEVAVTQGNVGESINWKVKNIDDLVELNFVDSIARPVDL